MDARFRFFRSGRSFRVWPPVDFPNRPQWGGETHVMFQNASDDTLGFEDTDGALEGSSPGKSHEVPARSTRGFSIATSVVPGNAYVFTVLYPTTADQEPERLAYVADNPEIIIVG